MRSTSHHRARAGALGWLLLSALAVGFARPAHGEEADTPRMDVVYLVDVSSSMHSRGKLRTIKELLADNIRRVVRPGTQIAVVGFGDGTHDRIIVEVPRDSAGWRGTRDRIQQEVAALNATDSYTHLYEALERGFEILRGFKRRRPGHHRRILVLSDGPETRRRGATGKSLAEVMALNDQPEFRRGLDWDILYGHFGNGDEALSAFLQQPGAGRVVRIDRIKRIEWIRTRNVSGEPAVGRRLPGTWSKEIEFRVLSDAMRVMPTLHFSIDPAGLPEGMILEVRPPVFRLRGPETLIKLELSCRGAVPGVYAGAGLRIRPTAGTLHWIETPRIPLRFEVVQPRIEVASDSIDFGQVAPGSEVERKLVLVPLDEAAELEPSVDLTWSRPGESRGLQLGTEQAVLSGREEVSVRLAAPLDAQPGHYETVLVLSSTSAAILSRTRLPVRYEIVPAHVVVGSDEIVFGGLEPGGESLASLKLVSERGALGRVLRIECASLPTGIEIDVPESIRLERGTSLPLAVRVSEDVEAGRYVSALRLKGPPGVKVEPPVVPLRIDVTAPTPEPLLIPGHMDLGGVPFERGGEVSGRFDVTASRRDAGSVLELRAVDAATRLEGGRTTLAEGVNPIAFRIRVEDAQRGVHSRTLAAWRIRKGEESHLGDFVVRWEVGAPERASGTPAVRASLVGELGTLRRGEERSFSVVLLAEEIQERVELELHVARLGLPDGISTELPSRLVLEPGEGRRPVPFRIRIGKRVGSGAWQPVIQLRSVTKGVQVFPESLRLSVQVEANFLAQHGRNLALAACGVLVLLSAFGAILLRSRQRRRTRDSRVQLGAPTLRPTAGRPTWDDEGPLAVGDRQGHSSWRA